LLSKKYSKPAVKDSGKEEVIFLCFRAALQVVFMYKILQSKVRNLKIRFLTTICF